MKSSSLLVCLYTKIHCLFKKKRPKVQFNIPEVEEMHSLKNEKEAPPVEDFCTSLCVAWSNDVRRTCIGSISNALDSSVKYTMHAMKTLPTPPAMEVI